MTASESDALLAEPLPTSALSRCPEPYEEGMWDKPRSPHQAGTHPRTGRIPCPSVSSPLWTAMRVPSAKIPPAGFNPCLPSPSHKAPSGSEWVHEIKHDGYRLIARRDGNRVRLYTRRGLRLVRQVSLDNRGAAVPSGPLHHRGRGSGLGWEGRQVGFRQAPFPWP